MALRCYRRSRTTRGLVHANDAPFDTYVPRPLRISAILTGARSMSLATFFLTGTRPIRPACRHDLRLYYWRPDYWCRNGRLAGG